MGDPLRTFKFHIGDQTRDFKWDMKALRALNKIFPGRRILDLLREMDPDVICEFGSAGLFGAGDSKSSADRVGKWIDKSPELYVPFAAFVSEGVLRSFQRFLPAEDQAEMGEALAALTAAKTKSESSTTATPSDLGSETSSPLNQMHLGTQAAGQTSPS